MTFRDSESNDGSRLLGVVTVMLLLGAYVGLSFPLAVWLTGEESPKLVQFFIVWPGSAAAMIISMRIVGNRVPKASTESRSSSASSPSEHRGT